MRILALIAGFILVSFEGGVALGQNEPTARERGTESPDRKADDEVIVTGKRLGELRLEVKTARQHAYDVFNEINGDDDFDVSCRDQTRVFSHAKVNVCRAQFERRIEAEASKQYLEALMLTCPGNGGVTQACIFSGYGARALARSAGVESPLENKRNQLNDMIVKLANENQQFAQAILDFYAAHQKYETARKPARQAKDEDD